MITYNNAKDNQLDILSEDFTSSDWSNYVTYDNTTTSGQLSKFPTQSRKNLRSFVPVKGRGLTMLELNALGAIGYWNNDANPPSSSNPSAGWADNYTMTELLTNSKTTEGEVWTNGTVAYNDAIGIKQNCLAIDLSTNAVITTESSFDAAVDLTNFSISNSQIDFAFPNYSSNPIQSVQVTFSSANAFSSEITLNVLNNSNKASVDLSSIPYNVLKGLNKIQLKITRSGAIGTFYCSQIICVSKNYVYPVVDWNTQTNRLTKTSSVQTIGLSPGPVGSTATTTIEALWAKFPPMIKSYAGITTGTNSMIIGDCSKDPQPVNINASMIFNTGLLPTSGDNQIGLILRETGNLGKTQSALNVLTQNNIPGPLTLSPKLAPSNDKTTTHLYFVSVSWNSTGATIKFEDENQTGRAVYYNISITGGLLANTNYEFNVLLEDNKFRVIINRLNNQYNQSDGLTMNQLYNLGNIGYWDNTTSTSSDSNAGWADDYQLSQINGYNVIHDTGWIYDPKIQRRKGRFGWWANLLDNRSYVRKIAVNSASYAEYVSNPLKSKTPVNGVQVFSESSPAIRKFTKGYAFGSGAILSNTKTGEYVISTVTSGDMVQGFCTNDFTVNNSKLKIDFNLFVNNKNDISAYLLSTEKDIEIRIDLSLGNIKSNQINKINLILNNLKFGNYKLYVVQETLRKNQITINNLTINSPQVQWSAKPNAIDDWVDYDLDNTSMNEGLMFSERGKNLQIKGVAKTQFASIKKVKSVPKYADLGAFQWSDSINSFRNITDTRLNKQSSGFYISTSADPVSDGSSLTKIKVSKPASITSASGNGTTITYIAANNFIAGETITITDNSNSTLNLTSALVASATSTQFTVTSSVTVTGTGGIATPDPSSMLYETSGNSFDTYGLTAGIVYNFQGYLGKLLSITNATGDSSTVTYTTNSKHVFQPNNFVTISGSDIAGYNGVFKIKSVPTETTFTVENVTTGDENWTNGTADFAYVKYQWLFDDGTVQTGKSISYKFNYAPDGTSFTANEDEYCLHTVILKIYVNDKLIDAVTRRFYVQTL